MKIAILIPLHEPKFESASNLIKSIDQNLFDIYLVFTNHKEWLKFNSKYYLNYKTFILSQSLSEFEIHLLEQKAFMPAFKKIHYVFKLIDQYDYVLPLDADFLVVNNEILKKYCDLFMSNKSFLGACVNFKVSHKIIENSMRILKSHPNFDQLEKFKSIYFWLSEIPIYEKQSTKDFYNFIEYKKNYKQIILEYDFHFFDTLAYNYFCMLEYSFEIKQINWIFSLEDCPLEIWNYVNSKIKKLNSIKHNIYSGQDVALLIHLDRKYGESYMNAEILEKI